MAHSILLYLSLALLCFGATQAQDLAGPARTAVKMLETVTMVPVRLLYALLNERMPKNHFSADLDLRNDLITIVKGNRGMGISATSSDGFTGQSGYQAGQAYPAGAVYTQDPAQDQVYAANNNEQVTEIYAPPIELPPIERPPNFQWTATRVLTILTTLKGNLGIPEFVRIRGNPIDLLFTVLGIPDPRAPFNLLPDKDLNGEIHYEPPLVQQQVQPVYGIAPRLCTGCNQSIISRLINQLTGGLVNIRFGPASGFVGTLINRLTLGLINLQTGIQVPTFFARMIGLLPAPPGQTGVGASFRFRLPGIPFGIRFTWPGMFAGLFSRASGSVYTQQQQLTGYNPEPGFMSLLFRIIFGRWPIGFAQPIVGAPATPMQNLGRMLSTIVG
ncbi:maker154 [Drosophila busckii]|uniref:Maker154 n=1 Tax=Drosophila busckii TaxID=30019 RepID=A0A0M4EGT7_DROBS|nr:uncharacterized protein LOC108595705 [Drosophila busckii]ALC42826.1 maker154 [Drosophila busckii]